MILLKWSHRAASCGVVKEDNKLRLKELHKALVILASTNLNEIAQRADLRSAICIVLIASCFTGIKRR